jgi:hypothetical protein
MNKHEVLTDEEMDRVAGTVFSRVVARAIEQAVLSKLKAQADTCRRCGGQMQPGVAIEQTWTGTPDFPGHEVVTMSPGGPGKLVACRKCPGCGHSVGQCPPPPPECKTEAEKDAYAFGWWLKDAYAFGWWLDKEDSRKAQAEKVEPVTYWDLAENEPPVLPSKWDAAEYPNHVPLYTHPPTDTALVEAANNDAVICPSCCTEFRAIPVTVQKMLLDAGFEPPFTHPPTDTVLLEAAEAARRIEKQLSGAFPREEIDFDDVRKVCAALQERGRKV